MSNRTATHRQDELNWTLVAGALSLPAARDLLTDKNVFEEFPGGVATYSHDEDGHRIKQIGRILFVPGEEPRAHFRPHHALRDDELSVLIQMTADAFSNPPRGDGDGWHRRDAANGAERWTCSVFIEAPHEPLDTCPAWCVEHDIDRVGENHRGAWTEIRAGDSRYASRLDVIVADDGETFEPRVLIHHEDPDSELNRVYVGLSEVTPLIELLTTVRDAA